MNWRKYLPAYFGFTSGHSHTWADFRLGAAVEGHDRYVNLGGTVYAYHFKLTVFLLWLGIEMRLGFDPLTPEEVEDVEKRHRVEALRRVVQHLAGAVKPITQPKNNPSE